MNTLIAIGRIVVCVGVDYALSPFQDGERGVIGPILAVLAVIVLNVLMLAFALRLRRYFHSLGERNEEE